jgi:hypothetical protein
MDKKLKSHQETSSEYVDVNNLGVKYPDYYLNSQQMLKAPTFYPSSYFAYSPNVQSYPVNDEVKKPTDIEKQLAEQLISERAKTEEILRANELLKEYIRKEQRLINEEQLNDKQRVVVEKRDKVRKYDDTTEDDKPKHDKFKNNTKTKKVYVSRVEKVMDGLYNTDYARKSVLLHIMQSKKITYGEKMHHTIIYSDRTSELSKDICAYGVKCYKGACHAHHAKVKEFSITCTRWLWDKCKSNNCEFLHYVLKVGENFYPIGNDVQFVYNHEARLLKTA